jgi:hypothetical protein
VHFIDDTYLAGLASAGELAAEEDSGLADLGVTTVAVDIGRPYFDIEVISDIRLDGPEPAPGGTDHQPDAMRLRGEFAQRVKTLRKAFAAGRPPHMLICCGDLVAARRDASSAEAARTQAAYLDIFARAFTSELAWGRSDSKIAVMAIPGNDDIYVPSRPAQDRFGAQAPAGESYYLHLASALASNALPAEPQLHPVASVFRVLGERREQGGLRGAGAHAIPFAYIAVIGFDSNDAMRMRDLRDYGQISSDQLNASRRLVATLRSGLARNAPLFVIAVTHHNLLPVEDRVVSHEDGQRESEASCSAPACDANSMLAVNSANTTSNAFGFMHHCQELRVSAVLHGHMHAREVSTVTSLPIVPGQEAAELTVIGAPTFEEGNPASGISRVRLDLWKGQMEIAFAYDRGPDGKQGKPIQVTRPLISGSRVSVPERRLLSKVSDLIAAAHRRTKSSERPAIERFSEHVTDTWARQGYVPLCLPDGRLPRLSEGPNPHRYNLLLLLREAEDGRYEILLSRHTPLRPNPIGDWDTLLLPAFANIRALVQRLHDDVIRQVVEQAEDMEKAASAKEFESAIQRILDNEGNTEEDVWQDQVREVGIARSAKISPTNGYVTEYEYHLVALMPFVRKATPQAGLPERDRRRIQDERKIVDWLNELPSVRRAGESLAGPRAVPIEAVMSGGAGLRWEPPPDPDNIAGSERGQRRLPPGAVWFPLPETDELASPWLMCPSIVARNSDVMRWVDEEMRLRRQPNGRFLPHLVMGQFVAEEGFTLLEGPFPFEAPVLPPEAGLARSTVQALRRVQYSDSYDLRGQRPYEGKEIHRIALVRRTVTRNSRQREMILVFNATEMAGRGRDLTRYKRAPYREALGYLRPAQRYVLRAGLERAREVNAFTSKTLGEDPWGFLRASWGGFAESVALTPPIVEQLHPDDAEFDDEGIGEFVLCDGNHRVVQRVWNDGEVAAAVAVLGQPSQPYYARAFSAHEWDITAGTELFTTPDAAFKHAARRVDLASPEFSPQVRQRLAQLPAGQLYRRYYRDLSFGFGPMGGQGGRYV